MFVSGLTLERIVCIGTNIREILVCRNNNRNSREIGDMERSTQASMQKKIGGHSRSKKVLAEVGVFWYIVKLI